MMIRRHFLGGVMGARWVVAAALTAGGASAAEAATVNHVKITLTHEIQCGFSGCDDLPGAFPKREVSDLRGIPVGQATTGWLSISDKNERNDHKITFSFGNQIKDLGFFSESGTIYSDIFGGSCCEFLIGWNGVSGFLSYRDDGRPWALSVHGTIELAPVPLAASATLLPLGVGALALMRRRRLV